MAHLTGSLADTSTPTFTRQLSRQLVLNSLNMLTHSGTPSYGGQGSAQLADLNLLPARLQFQSLGSTLVQLNHLLTPAPTPGRKQPHSLPTAGTPEDLRALRSPRAVWCKEVAQKVPLQGRPHRTAHKKTKTLIRGQLGCTSHGGHDTGSRPALPAPSPVDIRSRTARPTDIWSRTARPSDIRSRREWLAAASQARPVKFPVLYMKLSFYYLAELDSQMR